MKEFKDATIEIVEFDTIDVLTASQEEPCSPEVTLICDCDGFAPYIPCWENEGGL